MTVDTTPVSAEAQRVAAFLFNRKVDALRCEVYAKLIAYVLRDDTPRDKAEIAEAAASCLGLTPSASFRAVVSHRIDELSSESDRTLLNEEERYRLNRAKVPQEQVDGVLESQYMADLEAVAARVVTAERVASVITLLHDVAARVAESKASFIGRGLGLTGWTVHSGDILGFTRQRISELRIIGLDADAFFTRLFLDVEPSVDWYVTSLVQARLLVNLLTWQPDLLEYRRRFLSDKQLFLDTNVLFQILQPSARHHFFLRQLIDASRKELGVQVLVHTDSLRELRTIAKVTDSAFRSGEINYLQNVVAACKATGEPYLLRIENAQYRSFLASSGGVVTMATWEEFTSHLSDDAIAALLKELDIAIDRPHVPDKSELAEYRAQFIEASRVHRRRRPKLSALNDAVLFDYIYQTRKQLQSDAALGYDRYLLTLDTSLNDFLDIRGIGRSDTYFLYADQWYDAVFPLLRTERRPELAAGGMAAFVGNLVFPQLQAILPLPFADWVFQFGGKDLPPDAIHTVIEKIQSHRLMQALQGKNDTAMEIARLQIRRWILEEQLKLDEATAAIRREMTQLEAQASTTSAEMAELQRELEEKEARLRRVLSVAERLTTAGQVARGIDVAQFDDIMRELGSQATATAMDQLRQLRHQFESERQLLREQAQRANENAHTERERNRRWLENTGLIAMAVGILAIGLGVLSLLLALSGTS